MVPWILKYKKPAFWIIIAAFVVCIAVAVCLMTSPRDDQPDLSFLNYKNAITLIYQDVDGVMDIINYPKSGRDTDLIQPVTVADIDVARYLEGVNWKKRGYLTEVPSSPGSVEFIIADWYRITVYKEPRVARVLFGGEDRYYRINTGDYEAALDLLHSNMSAPVPLDEETRRKYEIDLHEMICDYAPEEIKYASVHISSENGAADKVNAVIFCDDKEKASDILKELAEVISEYLGIDSKLVFITFTDQDGHSYLSNETSDSASENMRMNHEYQYDSDVYEETWYTYSLPDDSFEAPDDAVTESKDFLPAEKIIIED